MEYKRKLDSNTKKNSASNKSRNNIREFLRPNFRRKQNLNLFYFSINLLGKLDEKNDLDFLN
jgi:hypothetical protein